MLRGLFIGVAVAAQRITLLAQSFELRDRLEVLRAPCRALDRDEALERQAASQGPEELDLDGIRE